ncbi:uncharacterized protein LOC132193505 isoform X1 [Neocloeon triangulifer]|uniref:uncharacterized protein LOC132193505 isoform X1 n=1 Tax=Neocloeon triangulifer TaxID=2078957 RepID=UPI00286ECCC9|nr:uncharacterized protein LOC132193505 isoform X1 [Neocloeon triangulifer]
MASLKFMIVLAVVLIATLSTVSARIYLLEIDDEDAMMRHKRQGFRAPYEDRYRAVPSNHRPTHAAKSGQEFQARIQEEAPLSRARRSPGKEGVVGPVHTFVKTDKHANFKWGVKHHVGKQYAG